MLVVAAAAIVAAILVIASDHRTASRSPAHSAASSLASVPSGSARPLRVPFVTAGARFAVFVNPSRPWVHQIISTGHPARPLLLIEVLVRNLSNRSLDPFKLRYRVRDSSGAIYGPLSGLGTWAQAQGAPTPVPKGTLTVVELAFQVRSPQSADRFLFEPNPFGGQTISVALR